MSELAGIALTACKYRWGEGHNAIYIEERGTDQWAITRGGNSTLNTDFQWEYEPMPSGRTDDYLKRNRYTFGNAVSHLGKAIEDEVSLL